MQSRRRSLIEAIANVVVGYALAVATQIAVFSWFALDADIRTNMALGGVFTALSLIRGYALRRLFERWSAP
tara:strand:+ start:1380 stop:1592 length:213 start_codon:yes stop_codon:yes gene_type:complete